ncbi:oligosaccharide flippase family protein [Luteibacter sp. PPL554]
MIGFRRLLRGRLAINTSLALFWQLARVGSQALWLLAIARKLDAPGYGIFAGVAGLATFLGAFSGLGLGVLLLRVVAREPERFDAYWHKGLRWTLLSGAGLALAFIVASRMIDRSHADALSVVAIGLSETMLFPVVSFCSFAFNAHERLGFAAALPALTALVRLAGALAFLVLPLPSTIATYSVIHLGATLLAAVGAVAMARGVLRPRRVIETLTRRDLGDGLGYCSVWAATNALTSLDKSLVLHLAGDAVAGLYASAYRLITIFSLPVDALAMSVLPRVFRHHAEPAHRQRLILVVFLGSLAFSAMAMLLVYAAAPALPWLLGPSFVGAVSAARMLAWLLPAYALRMLGGNVLLGLDGQWLRLGIESAGIMMLCVFGGWFVPHAGLAGAARMIVTTEACLALITWGVVARRLRGAAVAAR